MVARFRAARTDEAPGRKGALIEQPLACIPRGVCIESDDCFLTLIGWLKVHLLICDNHEVKRVAPVKTPHARRVGTVLVVRGELFSNPEAKLFVLGVEAKVRASALGQKGVGKRVRATVCNLERQRCAVAKGTTVAAKSAAFWNFLVKASALLHTL